MALNLKAAGKRLALLRRMPSAAFLLQAGACSVVAWSLWHGGLTQPPSVTVTAPAPTAPGTAPAAPATTVAPAMSLASATPLADAQAALSAIDVIVTRNDTLDHIFRRWKLNLADLASMRSLPGVRANLDSLRPGELLHLWHKDGQLFGLERRLNESQTLKVSRDGDQLKADVVQNALDTRSRTVRGRIDSSLFEAVETAGAHDQTAVALADIFGWDIDFVLDVRPGDTFAVTYSEIWRDGKFVKDGPIEAAEFVNQGREFRAVRYVDPDGESHYYTPDGRSMHKAFLRAPVEFTRVSSRFNSARLHPILNRIRAHKGVDYAAPIGTPVKAAGDGSIRFAGVMGGYGNVVEIEHSRSVMTVYGHLSRFARGTRVGTHVTQGTVIAYVGMTGLATGPHLHYEYRVNGVFKNPQTVPLPSAAPIDARYKDDFLARTAPLLATLDVPQGPMLVAR
ncbi:MAG TPA: peptidoglycan DD-metalloendopeptidase family protein [Steroidobacteraceae bacterium]|nr:peptidoglycan DD-metalloendopeptidase family protein [Steroidobacteraceae bacterium]